MISPSTSEKWSMALLKVNKHSTVNKTVWLCAFNIMSVRNHPSTCFDTYIFTCGVQFIRYWGLHPIQYGACLLRHQTVFKSTIGYPCSICSTLKVPNKCPYIHPIILMSCTNELARDKTNKMACALSKDSDQPGQPSSLIRIFAVRMKKASVLSYPLRAQWRLWSDWADAQADLSLH